MSNYQPTLGIIDTEIAIKVVKDQFEKGLAQKLNLLRVSAPLFVKANTGLNDDLNGIERPVQFDIKGMKDSITVVQSLAKWKRFALKKYGMKVHEGLYTDMNAIRRDEDLDDIHSVYVDQWDWEKIIVDSDRNLSYLETIVRTIYQVIVEVQIHVQSVYPQLINYFAPTITFITSQDLLDLYPHLDSKQREYEITKKYGAVFIQQIGHLLSNGKKHDGRAPDYDDWELNGDILVFYPPLNKAIELSSMGIRVNEKSLLRQLQLAKAMDKLKLPFHQALLHQELPLTIGGGIGQSRLCQIMLNKHHIGEVQSSVWGEDMDASLKKFLL